MPKDGQHSESRKQPGVRVAVGDSYPTRRQVRCAGGMVGEVAKPAYSLSDYPKSRSLSSRAVLTVSRKLRYNEIRIWLTQNFRAETHTLQLARPEILDDDSIGRAAERERVCQYV